MNEKKDFVEGFCKILVKNGAVSQKEADSMVKNFHNRSQTAFDFFLIDEGLVSKEKVLKALSDYYKVPSMDVTGYFFDHDLLRNFPKDFLLEHAVIPMEVDQDILILVASRPDAPGLLEGVEEHTSYEAEFLVGETQSILDAIQEYYDEPPEGYIRDLDDEDELEDEQMVEGADVDDLVDKDRW